MSSLYETFLVCHEKTIPNDNFTLTNKEHMFAKALCEAIEKQNKMPQPTKGVPNVVASSASHILNQIIADDCDPADDGPGR